VLVRPLLWPLQLARSRSGSVRADPGAERRLRALRRDRGGESALRDQEGRGRHRLPRPGALPRRPHGQPGVYRVPGIAALVLRRQQAVAARAHVPLLRQLPPRLSQHRRAVSEERRGGAVVRAEAARVPVGRETSTLCARGSSYCPVFTWISSVRAPVSSSVSSTFPIPAA